MSVYEDKNKREEDLEEVMGEEVPDLEDQEEEAAEAQEAPEEAPSQDQDYQALQDQFVRLQADYANYKRRTENERQEYYKLGMEKLALGLLEVLDNFDRALETGDKEDPFYEGMVLISDQLYEILDKNDIRALDCQDQDFDPNFHHAVLVEEVEGIDEGKIIEVLQKGYTYGDKVIRPAMVKVSQ